MPDQIMFDFMMPNSDWCPPADLPDLEGPIAIDLETRDPFLKKYGPGWAFGEGRGDIAGVAIASDNFKGYYPVGHEGGGNIIFGEQMFKWLKKQLEKPRPVVFANCQYDIGWLMTKGITPRWEFVHDVQIQAPLIDENRLSFSLNNLLKDYMGTKKDENLLYEAARAYGLKDTKGDMWRLPAPFVGPYAEADASETLALWHVLNKHIDEQELHQVYDMERKLVPILIKMRMKGVRVDLDKADKLKRTFESREKEAIKWIKQKSGIAVDPWAAESCAKALVEVHGVEIPLTEKTQAPSITKENLENWASQGMEVAEKILEARRMQKAYGTFIENFIFGHEVNGRIHCQFNQLRSDDGGTVSGRFSSSDPNLQQIPARDPELGPAIRSLYLPDEGELWGALDYSSQEPRITVHYAHQFGFDGAEEAVKRYNTDPNTDYHQMVADICGIGRKEAKVINLGLAYGMGGAKLCHSLGLPTKWEEGYNGKMWEVAGDEGQSLLDKYNEKMPYMTKLNERATNAAKSRAYIKTLGGRRIHFRVFNPKTGRNEIWYAHKALNRLIQGSAADQMKAAMIAIYEAGKLPLLTVHDELAISIKDREEGEKWKRVMEEAMPLCIPNKVDLEIGENWGDSML